MRRCSMSMARSCMVLLLLATASPARAQDQNQTADASRAALLAAERDKKAAETVPPQRTRIERALYNYDNGFGTPFIFQPWHGLQLASGHFPAGAGTAFGVSFTRDLGSNRPGADPNRPNRVELKTLAAYSTRGYWRGAAGLNIYQLGGAPLVLGVRGQRFEYPQQDFFGLGQDSLETNRTSYLLR